MPKLKMSCFLQGVVGERSVCGEAAAVRRGGADGSENAGMSSAQEK